MSDNDKTPRQLVLGLLFGIAFGFLLQKGGVAKYHVLIGQLLLQDFTVVKVMLSAVVVGMIGIHTMRRLGLVELHVKPTRYGANIVGGLVFGAGFALSAYCPGTNAAAIGQGNFDGLFVAVGMLAGSWLFAILFDRLAPLRKWGDRGKLTLPEAIRIPRAIFIPATVVALVALLMFIDRFTVR